MRLLEPGLCRGSRFCCCPPCVDHSTAWVNEGLWTAREHDLQASRCVPPRGECGSGVLSSCWVWGVAGGDAAPARRRWAQSSWVPRPAFPGLRRQLLPVRAAVCERGERSATRWSLPKWPHWTGLGQAGARSFIRVPHAPRSVPLLSLGVSRELGLARAPVRCQHHRPLGEGSGRVLHERGFWQMCTGM